MADDSEVEIRGVKRPLVENYSDEEEEEEARIKEERSEYQSRHCPYLDTIDRHVLDFDFEKLCSVSLSHINVYACLVCGKYFQGRGRRSHAYTHSVQVGHHVFLNLRTLKFYCLPDNYEVIDSSLDDIKYVLNPTFAKDEILQLDKSAKVSRAFDGTMYLPGMVGLNNIKANDYLNVILQALAFIPPIRDFFLREENYQKIKRPPGDIMFHLVNRFGELIRKIWNPRNFKAHVSPHEMLQAVVLCSKKRFQFTEQGDPVEFLSWFLNSLHTTLGGTKKATSSVIYKTFQGKMRITSRKLPQTENDEELKKEVDKEDYKGIEHGAINKNYYFRSHFVKTLLANKYSMFVKILMLVCWEVYPTNNDDNYISFSSGVGNFKVHILHKGANKWYELQDLHVKEILPQVITLSDSYIQIYELQKE
ncbi:PREDICTED: U4/U6.U5 tri-snRNP-associated protein 2-like [Acropora digitifera]|uniref:U4/U6.U5 tri-snRNP-associated protein 2-like n=1 Tax=Acropora digitifera TaxID=70779 RepID=UPI00077B0850|nr:PREDICTED: U4/U6.U5 tri-snRNP-associated protein 2-like [Acropora digitifera]